MSNISTSLDVGAELNKAPSQVKPEQKAEEKPAADESAKEQSEPTLRDLYSESEAEAQRAAEKEEPAAETEKTEKKAEAKPSKSARKAPEERKSASASAPASAEPLPPLEIYKASGPRWPYLAAGMLVVLIIGAFFLFRESGSSAAGTENSAMATMQAPVIPQLPNTPASSEPIALTPAKELEEPSAMPLATAPTAADIVDAEAKARLTGLLKEGLQ